ncbi:MAG: MCP four helix bundle domain-containing protein [Deltaproteobacteria bacterium]|nr:MCP four helix bundle domain-containing protein [Deltaproteobacteria bacterium]
MHAMAKSHIFYDRYAKTKRRLFLLFFVMTFVSLGAGVGILKFSNLKTVGMGLETVYHNRVTPLEQLKIISDGYGIHIIGTANKVLNKKMSWEQGEYRLEETTIKIKGLWREYLQTYLFEEEKGGAKGLRLLFESADRATARLSKILLDKDHTALAHFIKKELYPSIEPVTAKIDELFKIQVRIVKDIHDKEQARYRFGLSLGSASIVVSIILFVLVLLQWGRFRALLDSL